MVSASQSSCKKLTFNYRFVSIHIVSISIVSFVLWCLYSGMSIYPHLHSYPPTSITSTPSTKCTSRPTISCSWLLR